MKKQKPCIEIRSAVCLTCRLLALPGTPVLFPISFGIPESQHVGIKSLFVVGQNPRLEVLKDILSG